ncbi:MAG: nitroreductase family deazaflavin-dependent oxidoreductase [Solirubrobacterales bacterium]
MPRWVARFNNKVGNKVQGIWAPYLPPWAVVMHVGRRSGQQYGTPVLAFKRGDRLFVNLVYGSDAQWVQNVLAAGQVDLKRGGRRIHATNPQVVMRGSHPGPLPFQTKILGRAVGILVLDLATAT